MLEDRASRFGIGFKHPDIPVFVDADIETDLANQVRIVAFERLRQLDARLLHFVQIFGSLAFAEKPFEYRLRRHQLPSAANMGRNAALARFFGTEAGHHPLIVSVFVQMKAKIDRAVVQFNEADALLDDMIAQFFSFSFVDEIHQAAEAGKTQQNVSACIAVTNVISPPGKMSDAVDSFAETAGGRFQIDEFVFFQHFADLLGRRIDVGFRHIPGHFGFVLQNVINLPFVIKIPVENRDVAAYEPFFQCLHCRRSFDAAVGDTVVNHIGKRDDFSRPPPFAVQKMGSDRFIMPIDITRTEGEIERFAVAGLQITFDEPRFSSERSCIGSLVGCRHDADQRSEFNFFIVLIGDVHAAGLGKVYEAADCAGNVQMFTRFFNPFQSSARHLFTESKLNGLGRLQIQLLEQGRRGINRPACLLGEMYLA